MRLGRVIDVQTHVLRTDCPITSGDSGGPLFDMQGRVVGIHSRISTDLTENLHGHVLAVVAAWQQLEAGQIYPVRPLSRFLDQLDVDRDGKLSRGEFAAEPLYGRIFDRLAAKFQIDPARAHPIEELAQVFGWRELPVSFFGPVNGRPERIGQSLRATSLSAAATCAARLPMWLGRSARARCGSSAAGAVWPWVPLWGPTGGS